MRFTLDFIENETVTSKLSSEGSKVDGISAQEPSPMFTEIAAPDPRLVYTPRLLEA